MKAAGPLVLGDFATSNLKYAKPGALIKFTSPDTRKFLNGTLVTSTTDNAEDRVWAKIGAVSGDGANGGLGNLESGAGPVTLNNILPDWVCTKCNHSKFYNIIFNTIRSRYD